MLFFALILLVGSIGVSAQTISPYLLGNNYWYNGTAVAYVMQPGGLMDQSDVQTIRIGGFGPNNYSDAQYLEYIRRINAMGAKPIVQVKASLSAQQAIDFIKLINVTNNLGVRVWSIGNEPDHAGGGSLSDAQVADYTKRIAAALKSVDPTITVIAAEYASYNGGRYANLIGGANSITGLVPGKDYYYVDVIGFHKYVITDASQLLGSINDLVGKINTANGSRPEGKKLKWCMGEFNSHYNNDQTADPDMKVWSFNNGQFHAELWGIGMQKSAFSLDSWSMLEGEVERAGTDLSLFDKNYAGRSTYWHTLMFGQNMKQNYRTSTDNQASVAIVAMGDATGTAVMIINKSKTTGYDFSLNLNNAAPAAKALTISVNAGINKEITGNIGATTTQMLVFCANGTLLKRYTYTKANADARTGCKIEQIGNCDDTPVLTTITLTPATSSIVKDETKQFTAVGKDQFGVVMPISPIWSVNNAGIISGSGLFSGTTKGSFIVKAQSGTVSGTATIEVTEASVLTSITVTPATPSIVKGQTQQFTAVGKDQNGTVMTIAPAWSANAPNGLFAGTTVGTFTVSAQSGTIVGSASITVTDDPSFPIPGKIEAEAFNTMQGIQTQPTTDTGGGLNIGYVDAGDWLDYKVNVSTAGKYNVSFRVASQLATGAFQLKVGATILATVKVPNTGGWQNWQTVVVPVTLVQGIQTLRIAATGAGLNINWFSFAVAPNSIKIEAESYATMFGIQTQATTDVGGGLNVGYTEPGDWLNYTVNVPTTGTYTINFRVASLVATGKIELRNAAGTTLTTLAQGATGGWQTWITKSVTANLTAGSQTLRIYYTGAGLNINWFELVEGGLKSSDIGSEIETISENEKVDVYPNPANGMVTIETVNSDFNFVEIHSLTGAVVVSQPIYSTKTVVNISSLKNGLYLISLKGNTKTISQKLIVK